MKQFHLICYFLFSFSFFAQEIENECLCFKVDTSDFSKIIKYGKILNQYNPSYLDHTLSLIENKDIVLFEKYYYFQKIDKQIKFDIAKKVFDYESKLMSYEDSLEYDQLKVLDNYLKIIYLKFKTILIF